MRTTVTIDDELLERAMKLTGITDPSEVIREALRVLVRTGSARRLAGMGNSDLGATSPPRRCIDLDGQF